MLDSHPTTMQMHCWCIIGAETVGIIALPCQQHKPFCDKVKFHGSQCSHHRFWMLLEWDLFPRFMTQRDRKVKKPHAEHWTCPECFLNSRNNKRFCVCSRDRSSSAGACLRWGTCEAWDSAPFAQGSPARSLISIRDPLWPTKFFWLGSGGHIPTLINRFHLGGGGDYYYLCMTLARSVMHFRHQRHTLCLCFWQLSPLPFFGRLVWAMNAPQASGQQREIDAIFPNGDMFCFVESGTWAYFNFKAICRQRRSRTAISDAEFRQIKGIRPLPPTPEAGDGGKAEATMSG